MKNAVKILSLIAIIAISGLTMTGCVTGSTIGGSAGGHGLIHGNAAKSAVSDGAREIASYTVILGLFDSGYAEFASAVKQAQAQGRMVTTTTTWLFVLTRYTAYAQ